MLSIIFEGLVQPLFWKLLTCSTTYLVLASTKGDVLAVTYATPKVIFCLMQELIFTQSCKWALPLVQISQVPTALLLIFALLKGSRNFLYKPHYTRVWVPVQSYYWNQGELKSLGKLARVWGLGKNLVILIRKPPKFIMTRNHMADSNIFGVKIRPSFDAKRYLFIK